MKVEAFLYNDGVYTKVDLKYHGGKQTHASTFMVCLSEKKIRQHSPMYCSKFVRSCEAFRPAYLSGQKSPPLFSLQTKISSIDLLESKVTGNFKKIWNSTNKVNRKP